MRGRMNQDQFLLKWNNHQNNFVEVFNFLRTQDAFVDVTLACDGKSFSAHKVVLSACSPYFQVLFQANPCKHPIVFLKDVKGQDMEALIEFIYKGEVSVSQTELGSLISTAENLKIKGLAEPERPIEKAVKRLASPPKGQATTISNQTVPGVPLQHSGHIALFQSSSPNAKRKRCDQYPHSSYGNGREKEEKISLTSSIISDNHRENSGVPTSQVLLVPSQDPAETATDLSSQPTHQTLSSTDGVLYSVAGTAIYVGSNQTGGTNRNDVRDVYSSTDYNNTSEGTIPGTSGVQATPPNESTLNIKLEPTVPVATEGWDGSNQSYEDGGGTGSDGTGGGGGSVGTPTGSGGISTNDPISLTLPLHSELTESSPIHDSPRMAAARAILRALGAATSPIPKSNTRLSESSLSKYALSLPGHCKVCGKSIPRGEHRSHMASHTTHRPLHCSVCGRGFHQTEDLKRHIRIHTGEKPYKCITCGIAFRQRGHLSRHIYKYHPGEESPRARSK